MSLVVHIPPPRLVDHAAGFRPTDVTAIGLVINRLAELERGPAIDAAALAAMGWQVQPPRSARGGWRTRSPYTTAWMPLPPVSTTMDGAAILRIPGWDYAVGRRRGHAFAFVQDLDRPERFFEQSVGEPPQCLARAWLHAWRSILLETQR